MAERIFDPDGQPRKPLIVGIGAQKAGTSWLSQMLSQHPQIWPMPLKEAQFFNYMFIPGHRYWIDWHYRNKPKEIRERFKRRGEMMSQGLDDYLTALDEPAGRFTRLWYLRLFQPAPNYASPMDMTPEYSQLPEEGVAFLANWLSESHFIYLIRDPADRAVSQLKMNLTREKRRPKDLDAWMKEIANPVLDERGDYAAYIPRWDRHAEGRVLYLPYGRVARDPRQLLEEVETFCEIGPWEYTNPAVKVFEGPRDITVPPEAVAALRARLKPQTEFLAERFGPEFAALTR